MYFQQQGVWLSLLLLSFIEIPVLNANSAVTIAPVINKYSASGMINKKIKALIALAGRLSLRVDWENGLKRGRKTILFNP